MTSPCNFCGWRKILEDPSVRGIAHFGAGVPLYLSGDLAAAKTHFEQFRECDDPAIRVAGARRFGLEPGIMLRAFDARVLFWRGCPVQYQREADEVLAMARALAHAPTLAFVIAMAVTTEQWHGNVDRVDALAKDLVALGNEHGMQVWLSEGSVLKAGYRHNEAETAALALKRCARAWLTTPLPERRCFVLSATLFSPTRTGPAGASPRGCRF